MEKKESSIIIEIANSGTVDVTFTGKHICKRVLLRVVKALKQGYRQNIREYRRNLMDNKRKQEANELKGNE